MRLSTLRDCVAELDGLVLEIVSPPEEIRPGSWLATGRSLLYPTITVRLASTRATVFDLPFVISVCLDLARHLRHAARSISPPSGSDEWSSWGPEVTFVGGRSWLVDFTDGSTGKSATIRYDGLEVVAGPDAGVPDRCDGET